MLKTPRPDSQLRLGVLLSNPPSSRAVQIARTAEQEGLGGLWLSEDLWHRGAVPLAAACAMVTGTLHIGVGVLNPYSRHPTQIAVDYGTLAELSGGRVTVGIGAGVEAWVKQMGLRYASPRTTLAEAAVIVKELLSQGRSSYRGKTFSLDDVSLGFEVSPAPPVLLGATREQSLRTCGEIGDGWIASVLEPVERIARGLRLIAEGASRANRSLDGFRVVQFVHFCCDNDSARARSLLKPIVGRSLRGEVRLFQEGKLELGRRDYLAAVSPGEYEVTLRRLAEGGDPSEVVPDALVNELAVSGTAQECAEALRRYADVGVREFAFLMPEGAIEAGMRTIGQEVAPLLGVGHGGAASDVLTSPERASGPGNGEGSSVRES